MPIYRKKKIINIAIPKTACTSLYYSLKEDDNYISEDLNIIILNGYPKRKGHLSISEFLNYYNDIDISKYKVITIIRNPFDRMFSVYNHIKNANKKCIYTNVIDINNRNFNEWLKYIYTIFDKIKEKSKEYGDDIYSYFIPQIDFLTVNNSIPKYIKIFRFEDLNELEKNINCKLIHINKGNIEMINYKDIYNQESINIIKDLYHKDLKIFDYCY